MWYRIQFTGKLSGEMNHNATIKSLYKIVASTKLTEPVIFCKSKDNIGSEPGYYTLLPEHLPRLLSYLYRDVNFIAWEETQIPSYEIIFDSRFDRSI